MVDILGFLSFCSLGHSVSKLMPECNFLQIVLSFLFQQEFEALHANFKPTWKRFKRSMANENYAKQFLKAVIVYNSDHIK